MDPLEWRYGLRESREWEKEAFSQVLTLEWRVEGVGKIVGEALTRFASTKTKGRVMRNQKGCFHRDGGMGHEGEKEAS
jgi:hypothetical protein